VTETRTRGLVGGPRPRWFPAQLVGLKSETRTARTLDFDVPGWPGHLAGPTKLGTIGRCAPKFGTSRVARRPTTVLRLLVRRLNKRGPDDVQ